MFDKYTVLDNNDTDATVQPSGPVVGYVLKMYPRFSETFIVSEILAREAAGEEIVIFSLRPPTDARFHPELARGGSGHRSGEVGRAHVLTPVTLPARISSDA